MRHGIEIGGGRGRRHAIAQAPERQPDRLRAIAPVVGIMLDRHPDVGIEPRHGKAARQHAHHFIRFAIQHQLAAQDVWVAAKPALPGAEGEYGHAGCSRLLVLGGEGAAQSRGDTEHLEEIR